VDECAKEIAAQQKWLTTRLKAAAPQALLVADRAARAPSLSKCASPAYPSTDSGHSVACGFDLAAVGYGMTNQNGGGGPCLQMSSS
jgi:hypothetical protein